MLHTTHKTTTYRKLRPEVIRVQMYKKTMRNFSNLWPKTPFFFLSPNLWSELRDTIFSNTGHCRQDYKSERPVSQRTQSRGTMFMSDGTQDRLDRLNSSHLERDFSMANNLPPNLADRRNVHM